MKGEKYYKPILITLGLAITVITIFYFNDYKSPFTIKREKLQEGLTGVDGNTIYLESPIENNGYIDQMIDDSEDIETNAQTLLNNYASSLGSSDTQNLTNIVSNQQNIQSSLNTVKSDYQTAVDGLQDEVNAVVSIRSDTLNQKQNEYDSLVNERQNKRRLVKNNKYYEERYSALSSILLRLCLIIIVFTGLIWLNNRGYLGTTAPSIIFPVLIAFSIFYIMYLYVDVQSRNSSDYSKIDFVFNPEKPNDNFTTIEEVSNEFNRIKKYNKEYSDENGKFSKIEPYVKPPVNL